MGRVGCHGPALTTCVSSGPSWTGMHIPKPARRFRTFDMRQRRSLLTMGVCACCPRKSRGPAITGPRSIGDRCYQLRPGSRNRMSTDRISEYLAHFAQTRNLMLEQIHRTIVGQSDVIEQILAAI